MRNVGILRRKGRRSGRGHDASTVSRPCVLLRHRRARLRCGLDVRGQTSL